MDNNSANLLKSKGVEIIEPASVHAYDIDPDRIQGPGTVIHPGCRLKGRKLFIGAGCEIGRQGPVTLTDCWLAPDVKLEGGVFQGAVFLKGAKFGPNGQVRPGTILEEHASAAHAVGLKQTILFPYVTLGSLINFCDCLMTGGTGPENHSEVGSSYIHFNFTPNQDKATASLIGDVPRGVTLRENPIFLGGQGGLVGPCRLAFGTVVAAGTIWRKDLLKEDRLVADAPGRSINLPFKKGNYTGLNRIVENNLVYLANITALFHWYLRVRSYFVGGNLPKEVYDGLLETLNLHLDERIARLGQLAEKASSGRSSGLHSALRQSWPELEIILQDFRNHTGNSEMLKAWMDVLQNTYKDDYLAVIKSLGSARARLASRWLRSIVRQVLEKAGEVLPGIRADLI